MREEVYWSHGGGEGGGSICQTMSLSHTVLSSNMVTVFLVDRQQHFSHPYLSSVVWFFFPHRQLLNKSSWLSQRYPGFHLHFLTYLTFLGQATFISPLGNYDGLLMGLYASVLAP